MTDTSSFAKQPFWANDFPIGFYHIRLSYCELDRPIFISHNFFIRVITAIRPTSNMEDQVVNLVSCGGVKLHPLGTSATTWPIVLAPDDGSLRSRWWNE
jgi:hypothetical protein